MQPSVCEDLGPHFENFETFHVNAVVPMSSKIDSNVVVDNVSVPVRHLGRQNDVLLLFVMRDSTDIAAIRHAHTRKVRYAQKTPLMSQLFLDCTPHSIP